MPFIRSIDILGYDNLLHFPHSAVFAFPPPDFVPYDAFSSQGIYVPLPLTLDAGAIEVDAAGTPTVHLGIDHEAPRTGTGARGKQEVVQVAREDAWALGRDPRWVEPRGTCRGVFSSDESPWERVMKALTQFIASRSSSYGKAYISHDAEFRSITGLHHHQSYAPHLPGHAVVPHTPTGWRAPPEEEEASGFIRDMEGVMKRYWTRLMESAHGRIHRITALESFQITHSFLHYLAHYQIFPPNEEPYLLASLHATIDTSTRLLPQIQLAQLIADALPGSSSAAGAGDSWHALALATWIRAPLVRSETEWEVNAQRMRERVEGMFTDAREESMARNMRDGLVGVGGDGDGDGDGAGEEEKQVEEGEGEGVDEYRYESDGEPQETAADWQDAETPDALTHVQAIDTLSERLGMDVSGMEAHDHLPAAVYVLQEWTDTRPPASSVPAERLDARFVGACPDRPGDFYWMTLVPEQDAGDPFVVLVDGKGLPHDRVDIDDVRGMRVRAQVVSVGQGRGETVLVHVLEGIVPRF